MEKVHTQTQSVRLMTKISLYEIVQKLDVKSQMKSTTNRKSDFFFQYPYAFSTHEYPSLFASSLTAVSHREGSLGLCSKEAERECVCG